MFRNSLRLFSIAGFEVKLHASWIIILLLITWSLATGFFPFEYRGLGDGRLLVNGNRERPRTVPVSSRS